MYNQQIVALVGKVGHGKTLLLNKLTGERYPSDAGARSCTRTLQFGYSKLNGLLVVDTPGFYASDNVAGHIAAQKIALEGSALSGIYIVIKFGRADDIAQTAVNIVNFAGTDDVRIIVTHSDTVSSDPMYDPDELKRQLSELIGVQASNIIVVGKSTDGATIEKFMSDTLHPPRDFTISDEQIAAVSSLCVCARRFDKDINLVYAKLAAASGECEKIVKLQGSNYEVDVAIAMIQKCTTDMVNESKERIFGDAVDLPEDQQNVIYGKAGLALSVKLKSFVDATNRLLSWDVTNPCDPRNVCKACPHCGAVFVKTEGCDGETTCGSIPSPPETKQRPALDAEFDLIKSRWIVAYRWNGCRINIDEALAKLKSLATIGRPLQQEMTRTENCVSVIESGCGAQINWSQMLPLDPTRLQLLGQVELQHSGVGEQAARSTFKDSLRENESLNLRTFLPWATQRD